MVLCSTYKVRQLQQCHCHRLVRSRQQRPRTRLLASSGADQQQSALKSLDELLGTENEQQQQQEQTSVQSTAVALPLRVPSWAWGAIQEPRVVPLASNVLYYVLLLVFVSFYVVQLADGEEVADDLIARLTNDHAAVASGDMLRLFTSFFVADRLQALIFGLMALATVTAELESLLGYSTFWAVWCCCIITGSLADAAMSSLPITAGPAPGVAGVVAALLAHHAHNWRVEQLLAQAKEGDIPQELLQLEGEHNRKQLQQDQKQQQPEATSKQESMPASEAPTAVVSSSSPSSPSSGSSSPSGSTLVETDLDGIVPSFLGWKLWLPREGKAFITLGGAAVSVLSALKDVSDAEAATDWTALAASFAAGIVLGWTTCPVYRLDMVEASSRGSSSAQAENEPEPDLLLPVLRDIRPPPARANAVVGYAAILFAALGGWLTSQQGLWP